MIMNNNINIILDYIMRSNDFIVTSHVNPDGDNIGSTLSMYYFLNKINKKVYYVLDDSIPLNIQFLVKDINIISSQEFKELNIKKYNLITLDCGDKKWFGQIIICPAIEAFHFVLQFAKGREHDDGRFSIEGSEMLA